MSREVLKAKERFRTAAFSACLKANQALEPVINVPFQISEWTGRAGEAYRDQWAERRHPEVHFDWEEIWRRNREIDALRLALWCEGLRLSALALCLPTNCSLEIRFLEGDYRSDCPLKGRRCLIVLEAAANYAQAIGKAELRVRPVNLALRSLYEDVFGFEVVERRGQETYFRRSI